MTRGQRIAAITGAGLLVVAVLAVLAINVVFDPYVIPSEANAPTLNPGDRVLVSATDGHGVERGDLVIYVAPGDPTDAYFERVARVVAIAGDTIDQAGGSVAVNGSVLDEPYLAPGTPTPALPALTVPNGHVFVLADNRVNSQDSRYFGPVPAENVTGRVSLRWWPLGSAGPP